MPGVTMQPSPVPGGFGRTTSSLLPRATEDMSISAIKANAMEAVTKEARGASLISLIKVARSQYFAGKDAELKGDLKNALSSFTKAASLAKMTMDSKEFQTEGRGGVLFKELMDLLDHDAKDMSQRTSAVEEKLRSFEKLHSSTNGKAGDDGRISQASGGSIADRLKALQEKGLAVSTTTNKRYSRDLHITPSLATPITPSHVAMPSAPTNIPGLSLPALLPSPPTSSNPSPHSFVSPSSLGPPSPTSSPSSSPQIATFSVSEFNHAYPSIDELDENPAFSLPSVPTGVSSSSSNRSSPNATSLRNFTIPLERPSSTPITPVVSNFISRPPSPSRGTQPKSSQPKSTSSDKIPIPKKNASSPKELQSYLCDHNVLLIDVRNRADFEREHIKTEAIVCIEPSVLLRRDITASSLEDSLVLSPKNEATCFKNRDKFDLVAVYDGSSTTFGNASSPLSILIRLISEQEFKKILKRMPMMLVGGIDTWKKEGGEITKGEINRYMDLQTTAMINGSSLPSSPNRKHIPTTNGSSLPPSPKRIPSSVSIPSSGSLISGPIGSPIAPPIAPSLSSSASIAAGGAPHPDQHEIWYPSTRARAETNAAPLEPPRTQTNQHRPTYSLDQSINHSRAPAQSSAYTSNASQDISTSPRRPTASRAPMPIPSVLPRSIPENAHSPTVSSPPLFNSSATIAYPQFRHISPHTSGSGPSSPFIPNTPFDIASPPVASINPSLSRRRSDYVDQSHETLLSFNHARTPIDYPELASPQIRPPPAAASSALERQDNRPRHAPPVFSSSPHVTGTLVAPKTPRIGSDYPVTYWGDIQIGTSGLKNMGNTCYMNAPIQCLSATVPFSQFFLDGRWRTAINYTNAMGTKGKLAGAFAALVHEMWSGDLPYLTPTTFRRTITSLNVQYEGTDQHDSQEFLSFLLDGIHEDLNRIIAKPTITSSPEREAELERLPPQIASEQEWNTWKLRNDSIIVDYFQGQFRSRLECMTCHKTSTTYNVFSILQLPIPHGRSGKVPLQKCLDALFSTEILDHDDAWDCPHCKTKRKATKQLSLARLPPVLCIHLKRFAAKGRFSDKIDTFVDFPMKSLDLSNLMPPPLPPGVDKGPINGGHPLAFDDPRNQIPPYKYDLYGVTNHIGNLSSGHYTSFVQSRGGWLYFDDSSVKPIDSKQVVGQRAYVLFYKRAKI